MGCPCSHGTWLFLGLALMDLFASVLYNEEVIEINSVFHLVTLIITYHMLDTKYSKEWIASPSRVSVDMARREICVVMGLINWWPSMKNEPGFSAELRALSLSVIICHCELQNSTGSCNNEIIWKRELSWFPKENRRNFTPRRNFTQARALPGWIGQNIPINHLQTVAAKYKMYSKKQSSSPRKQTNKAEVADSDRHYT